MLNIFEASSAIALYRYFDVLFQPGFRLVFRENKGYVNPFVRGVGVQLIGDKFYP